jgi:ring-1,2-phenylacetyl-CoA epoxidase subunit PaaE
LGIAKERIHTERFHTGEARKRSVEADANRKEEKVNIILDGRELIVSVAQDDESILRCGFTCGCRLTICM